MNRASPVDLRKSLEIANNLAHIGIRFVPIPVETEEEFQTLAASTVMPYQLSVALNAARISRIRGALPFPVVRRARSARVLSN
ncbi:Protein of uncharacterised function (DUF1382) [Enterobacter hormaechei]|nr:Protein of uncharacterised function (DUF1382) [Enterobacter hormaechei]